MDGMQSDSGMEQGQGGYCIEIYFGADGKPQSVNVEQKDAEDAEEGMPPPMPGAPPPPPPHDGEKGVPVASMEEAMRIVQQIVQNQGGMPNGQGDPDAGNEQDEMMQGYGKGNIGTRRSGLPVRKVFSEGM